MKYSYVQKIAEKKKKTNYRKLRMPYNGTVRLYQEKNAKGRKKNEQKYKRGVEKCMLQKMHSLEQISISAATGKAVCTVKKMY
jgi:hypothetical protein